MCKIQLPCWKTTWRECCTFTFFLYQENMYGERGPKTSWRERRPSHFWGQPHVPYQINVAIWVTTGKNGKGTAQVSPIQISELWTNKIVILSHWVWGRCYAAIKYLNQCFSTRGDFVPKGTFGSTSKPLWSPSSEYEYYKQQMGRCQACC